MDKLQKRLEDKQTQSTPLVTGYFQGGPGYATGSADTSDKDVYDAPAAFGSAVKRISRIRAEVSPKRLMPAWLTSKARSSMRSQWHLWH